jgi:hypothetical protein
MTIESQWAVLLQNLYVWSIRSDLFDEVCSKELEASVLHLFTATLTCMFWDVYCKNLLEYANMKGQSAVYLLNWRVCDVCRRSLLLNVTVDS